MISKLQSNSNLGFGSTSPMLKQKTEVQNNDTSQTPVITEDKEGKVSVSETYNKAKKGVTNFVKKINNVTNVTQGVTRGVIDGVIATTAVGVLGKACKENNFNVIGILKDTIKDVAQNAWSAIKFIPSIVTKSPLENATTILSLPKKFYSSYLKDHKAIAVLASVVGACVLAGRIIQGKVSANEKNADLDHKTNQGHV